MNKRLKEFCADAAHRLGVGLLAAWALLALLPLLSLVLMIWIWTGIETMFYDKPDDQAEGRGPWH